MGRHRSGWRGDMAEEVRGPGLEAWTPSVREGTRVAVVASAGRGGGGWFDNFQSKDVTKKGEPTGVDRGASNVKGNERGETGRETRRQKRACWAGMKGPTGTCGVGWGRQDSECRTGGGCRRNGNLFFKVIEDRNEGRKLGVKEWCSSVSGWRMVGGVSTRRVKGAYPENSQTVGRGFMIRR